MTTTAELEERILAGGTVSADEMTEAMFRDAATKKIADAEAQRAFEEQLAEDKQALSAEYAKIREKLSLLGDSDIRLTEIELELYLAAEEFAITCMKTGNFISQVSSDLRTLNDESRRLGLEPEISTDNQRLIDIVNLSGHNLRQFTNFKIDLPRLLEKVLSRTWGVVAEFRDRQQQESAEVVLREALSEIPDAIAAADKVLAEYEASSSRPSSQNIQL